MLNQFNKNFPAMLFEMVYYNHACDAYLRFYSNLKRGKFFLSTRAYRVEISESAQRDDSPPPRGCHSFGDGGVVVAWWRSSRASLLMSCRGVACQHINATIAFSSFVLLF